MQTSPDETGHQVYAFEGFTLNATSRSLKADNCDLELRPKSFDVLCCLVEHAGELVPKDDILRKVWSGIHVTDESLARLPKLAQTRARNKKRPRWQCRTDRRSQCCRSTT